MAGVNLSSIFGPATTQINRTVLKNALVTARKSGQPGMSIGVKTSVRNMVSNRVKPGTINSELDQFTKMGGKVPRPGTIGPNPTKGGKDFINASTDYADDVRTGDSDTFLANRVPEGTVGGAGSTTGLARIQSDLAFLKRNPGATSRPAPAARNMTSAQKGAVDARKGKGKKKKDKKKDNSWPVEPWGSMVSDGYKKGGSKGGMR